MNVRAFHRRLVATAFVALALVATSAQDDGFTPPADLEAGWYARIDTSLGRIVARLHPDTAPQAVAHFTALAEGRLAWHDPVTGESKKAPYYDGITVHFASAGRLFEVGLRPGAEHAPEIWVPNETASSRPFGRGGRLGFGARPPGISGVVFFVTAAPDRKLDTHFPCFATVVSDLDTVFRITSVKTRRSGQPLEPVVIERIRIFPVGEVPPLPEPVPYTPQRKAIE